MTTPDRNLQSHDRGFVFPVGSQVVLAADVTIADRLKKTGSVGVVLASPPHNDRPYTVRFADGSEFRLQREQLVLRRTEIDLLLRVDDFDYRPCIVYQCQVGSRAYGLDHEASDDDQRGVYLPPASRHWSLYRLPEQFENQEGAHDAVFWELEKYLRLALKANPNILETLWTPKVSHVSPVFEPLLEIREVFLSKQIYKTYSGYVLSQFRKMERTFRSGGVFKAKHAMHLLRLMHSGIAGLRQRRILVEVSEHRDLLLAVRNGEWTFDEVKAEALRLHTVFEDAFASTTLPEQPGFVQIDQFLIEARRSQLDV